MRNDFESNYLEHSAKGTSWKNVKYLKKVPLGNNRYYYIYTQAQLNAWNKTHSVDASNVLSNKERDARKSVAVSSSPTIEGMVRNGLKVKGQNAAEKTANMKKNIAEGENKIQKALASQESSEKKKSGSGGSSKSGSKKSGKSGSGKSKSSKEKSDSAKKEKSGSSKAEKKTSEKAASEKTTKKNKEQNNTPISMDSLKKIYGMKDEDVSAFSGSASDFKKNLLEKYKDGAFGYLSAGDKVYKFTIQNGDIILKDFDSDKEVSFDSYLKDISSFKEFQTNKKKK